MDDSRIERFVKAAQKHGFTPDEARAFYRKAYQQAFDIGGLDCVIQTLKNLDTAFGVETGGDETNPETPATNP